MGEIEKKVEDWKKKIILGFSRAMGVPESESFVARNKLIDRWGKSMVRFLRDPIGHYRASIERRRRLIEEYERRIRKHRKAIERLEKLIEREEKKYASQEG